MAGELLSIRTLVCFSRPISLKVVVGVFGEQWPAGRPKMLPKSEKRWLLSKVIGTWLVLERKWKGTEIWDQHSLKDQTHIHIIQEKEEFKMDFMLKIRMIIGLTWKASQTICSWALAAGGKSCQLSVLKTLRIGSADLLINLGSLLVWARKLRSWGPQTIKVRAWLPAVSPWIWLKLTREGADTKVIRFLRIFSMKGLMKAVASSLNSWSSPLINQEVSLLYNLRTTNISSNIKPKANILVMKKEAIINQLSTERSLPAHRWCPPLVSLLICPNNKSKGGTTSTSSLLTTSKKRVSPGNQLTINTS